MKLHYYSKNNKKVYTLKESVNGEQTKDAHYKFIRIRSLKENAPKHKTKSNSFALFHF